MLAIFLIPNAHVKQAGLGGCCRHMAAVLFILLDYYSLLVFQPSLIFLLRSINPAFGLSVEKVIQTL